MFEIKKSFSEEIDCPCDYCNKRTAKVQLQKKLKNGNVCTWYFCKVCYAQMAAREGWVS